MRGNAKRSCCADSIVSAHTNVSTALRILGFPPYACVALIIFPLCMLLQSFFSFLLPSLINFLSACVCVCVLSCQQSINWGRVSRREGAKGGEGESQCTSTCYSLSPNQLQPKSWNVRRCGERVMDTYTQGRREREQERVREKVPKDRSYFLDAPFPCFFLTHPPCFIWIPHPFSASFLIHLQISWC